MEPLKLLFKDYKVAFAYFLAVPLGTYWYIQNYKTVEVNSDYEYDSQDSDDHYNRTDKKTVVIK